MTDQGVMTLEELREHGRTLRGQDADTWDELWKYVEQLRRDLDDTRDRLGRRTRDMKTLVGVLRQLAAHVDFPLQEASNGEPVPPSVPESEPG